MPYQSVFQTIESAPSTEAVVMKFLNEQFQKRDAENKVRDSREVSAFKDNSKELFGPEYQAAYEAFLAAQPRAAKEFGQGLGAERVETPEAALARNTAEAKNKLVSQYGNVEQSYTDWMASNDILGFTPSAYAQKQRLQSEMLTNPEMREAALIENDQLMGATQKGKIAADQIRTLITDATKRHIADEANTTRRAGQALTAQALEIRRQTAERDEKEDAAKLVKLTEGLTDKGKVMVQGLNKQLGTNVFYLAKAEDALTLNQESDGDGGVVPLSDANRARLTERIATLKAEQEKINTSLIHVISTEDVGTSLYRLSNGSSYGPVIGPQLGGR